MQSSPTSMSFSCSRPGRFTQESGRWKKICGAMGMSDMLLCWGEVIYLLCKLHVALWEVLTPSYTNCTQSQQMPTLTSSYITELRSTHVGPYSRPHEHCQTTAAQTPGWGSLTDSIFPTIHNFSVPHCTIYVRVSSERVPWHGGQIPVPIHHNSSINCSNKLPKHKQ